jgi:hypothetical protein
MKTLTPGQAIRKFCLVCVGSPKEVKNCGGDQLLTGGACSFFKYRMGRGRPSVKLIRRECLFCMGGSRKLVHQCSLERCLLHPFRMGTNPNFSLKRQDRRAFIDEI